MAITKHTTKLDVSFLGRDSKLLVFFQACLLVFFKACSIISGSMTVFIAWNTNEASNWGLIKENSLSCNA